MASSDETPTGRLPDLDLDAELSLVNAERSELLRASRELRGELSDLGPTDAAERAALIAQAEELEALVAELEHRRDALLEKLHMSP
jgi:uncharacterized coiled-coil DUF342 family protein